MGDTVKVYIKGLDREKGKISLGYKRQETIRGRFSAVIIRWAVLWTRRLSV